MAYFLPTAKYATLGYVNFSAIEDALRTAIGVALALPDVGRYQAVTKGDGPQSTGMHAPGTPRVRYTIHDGLTQGQDGVFHNTDGQPVVSGPRNFWVSVKIETQTQAAGRDAQALARQLVAGLRFPRVSKALDAADIGISTVRPPVNSSYMDSDRRISVAVIDLVCQSAENATDTVQTVETFDHIELSPSDETGNDLSIVDAFTVGPPA